LEEASSRGIGKPVEQLRIRMKKTIPLLACGLLCGTTASPAEIPEPIIPAGVGVNIHFVTAHERDLDTIAAAGFKFVRMDFGWAGIEREKGEYQWSGYDELTANLEKRGLRAMYILDYSNPLYEETVTTRNPVFGGEQKDTASPQHPESVTAFARWAAAAAQHFKGRHIIWEIWNEPNITFWKPKPDAKQYNALALATCQAIRAVDPQATIVGPATSEIPLKFLEDFCASGVLEYLDAVSVHPYRNYSKPPESAAEDYQWLRELIARHAPTTGKKTMPVLSGEWGYASHTKGVSLETQAAFIARQQLANLLDGVPLSIWYDWKNDGTDANEREHNFGTVTPDLQPKPSYKAVQTLTRELTGYRITRRVAVGTEKDYVLLCTNAAGHEKLAAWTLDEPHAVTLGIKSNPDPNLAVTAVKGDGAGYGPKLEPGRLVLDLDASPKYVSLKSVELGK
jgi:hypothetical protein